MATVTIPDEVYRRASIRAAEQGRSVSSLVAELLTRLEDEEDRFERLAAQQDEVLAEVGEFRAADRLERIALYALRP